MSLRSSLRPHYHTLVRKPVLRLLPPLLQRLPLSSTVFGPPKGTVASTKEWVEYYNSNGKRPLASYTKVGEGQHIRRTAPKTIHAIPHSAFKELEAKAEETFVASIPNGRTWGQDGAIITPDDKLLTDVSAEYDHERYIRGKHSVFSQVKLPPLHVEDGTVAVLTTLSADYYAHWLLDILPRIELLEQAGYSAESIDKFYLVDCQSPYQKETLNMLGVPEAKIIDSKRFPHIQASKLLVPSLVSGVFKPTKQILNSLRDKLSSTDLNSAVDRPRRIYISRSATKWRRVVNEDEVVHLLNFFGFTTIRAEDYTVAEKSALFSEADVIVAAAGSGYANMLFCKPGTTVIEFFHPESQEFPTWFLCDELDLNYFYFFADGCIPGERAIKADIKVNIDFLRQTLQHAGVDVANGKKNEGVDKPAQGATRSPKL